jgi:hypothetical protein
MQDHQSHSSSAQRLELLLLWLLVGIPLLWGVAQTAVNAAKLFSPG